MIYIKKLKKIILWFLVFNSSLCFSLVGFHTEKKTKIKNSDDRHVILNPYSSYEAFSFKEFAEGRMGLVGANKKQLIRDFLLQGSEKNEHLDLQETQSINAPAEVTRYNYYYKKIPLCYGQVKVIRSFDLLPLILGKNIKLSAYYETNKSFDFFDQALSEALKDLAQDFPGETIKYQNKHTTCYFYDQGTLHPSFKIKLSVGAKPYELLVSDSRVLARKKLFFSLSEKVTGKVQTYERNEVLSDLEIFSFDFVGDKTLHSKNFVTSLASGATDSLTRAKSKTHEFLYDPKDPYFAEASFFSHAQMMYDFFEELGYKEWRKQKIVLNAYDVFGMDDDENNATYVPYDDLFDDAPSINIGRGDGHILENLLVDSDVVGHELSHHILFENLSSTRGESLAIHEGMADYFAFAKSGDPCLGESICPKSSFVCFVYNRCLRTADNALVYDKKYLSSFDWHVEGQILSGVLWDLRQETNSHDFDKLVLRSTQYHIENMDYYGLIFSLIRADDVTNKGKNQCLIYEAFAKRGFSHLLTDLSCDNVEKWPEPTGVTYDEELWVVEEPEPEEKEEDPSCGALAIFSTLGTQKTLMLLMLIFLWPFCLVLSHKFYLWAYSWRRYLSLKGLHRKTKNKKPRKRFFMFF